MPSATFLGGGGCGKELLISLVVPTGGRCHLGAPVHILLIPNVANKEEEHHIKKNENSV